MPIKATIKSMPLEVRKASNRARAIKFAQWIIREGWEPLHDFDSWELNYVVKSTTELYDIYINQNENTNGEKKKENGCAS